MDKNSAGTGFLKAAMDSIKIILSVGNDGLASIVRKEWYVHGR
jgi:hypothetical protein